MRVFRVVLQPKTAFASMPNSELIFGQLCWAIRHQHGKSWLQKLLSGYTTGQPFLVVSDFFPEGYVVRPTLPSHYVGNIDIKDRKKIKKQIYLPTEKITLPVTEWSAQAVAPNALYHTSSLVEQPLKKSEVRTHNSIDRLTGTTGTKDAFAPFTNGLTWYHPEARFVVYVVANHEEMTQDVLQALFMFVGLHGIGRDASIGLGKFEVEKVESYCFPTVEKANAYLTLGSCAPYGNLFDTDRSFYQVMTHFGRHGDFASSMKNPFKKPLLLAKTAGLFTPRAEQYNPEQAFIGHGLGGKENPISWAMDDTVHQGYAPVIPVYLPEIQRESQV